MKSKFTHEERQAILDRYISKSESPTSIIRSVGISKSTFYKWLSDYRAEQAEAKRMRYYFENIVEQTSASLVASDMMMS